MISIFRLAYDFDNWMSLIMFTIIVWFSSLGWPAMNQLGGSRHDFIIECDLYATKAR